MGHVSLATGEKALALGANSDASGAKSMAIGSTSIANGEDSISIGDNAQSKEFGVALGGKSNVNASEENAVALGNGAKSEHVGSVALGSNSETEAARGTSDALVNGYTFEGFAATHPNSTVSVGKSGAERTITNVAAGRVTSNSTDAINGSQLYATNNMLTNVSETITTILGGNAEIEQHGNNLGKIRTYNIGGTDSNYGRFWYLS